MRQRHTNIPWGPVPPIGVFTGYKEFVLRQQMRLKAVIGTQRRIKVFVNPTQVVRVLARTTGANEILEVKDVNY